MYVYVIHDKLIINNASVNGNRWKTETIAWKFGEICKWLQKVLYGWNLKLNDQRHQKLVGKENYNKLLTFQDLQHVTTFFGDQPASSIDKYTTASNKLK